MISAERRLDHPNVSVVTKSGVSTGGETIKKQQTKIWIIKEKGKAPMFDPRKENETFVEAHHECMRQDLGAFTSFEPRIPNWTEEINMPMIFSQTLKKEGQVIPLKNFLRSCFNLLKDEIVVK